MDVPLLRAFAAVAETRSVSRAAETLHLTQPSISKRVALLERGLGRKLFDRVGRELALNEAGRALLPHAHRILTEVEDGRRALAQLSGEVAGRLSVGTSHHIGLHRLPPVLRTFVAKYPGVELDLHFMDSEQACHAVRQNKLELGIVTLPLEPMPQLATERVWPDPMGVLVARKHPLAQARRPRVADLALHPAILPDEKTFTHRLVRAMFARAGLTPRVLLSTNYLETIRMLVGIGLGWSVLPVKMLDRNLVQLRLPGIEAQRDLGAVWNERRSLGNAAQALLRLLREDAARPASDASRARR